MRHPPVGITLSTLVTLACGGAATHNPDQDRQAIATVTAQTQAAENAGSVEQMRPHFADDVVMMGPNTPTVTGADSVAAAMRAFFDAFTVQIQYTSMEIVVIGDWAFDRGTYHHTLTPKSGGVSMLANGRYLWLYRRHPDGSWKQSRVMWNSSDPVPLGGV